MSPLYYYSPNHISKVCFAIVLVLATCYVAFSQQSRRSSADSLQLSKLKGFTQTYYYSPGHEARAKSIAVFMENAGRYFQNTLRFTPKATFYILAAVHWKSIAAAPLMKVYGFPHNDGDRLIIAAEDNDFWRSFLPSMNELPAGMRTQVEKAYRMSDGSYSMMPFFDLLALHELGHSYTNQAGLKMHRHWMGELFVNIMLHTYVAEKQPELLSALVAFPNMVVGRGSEKFKFTSLADFERLYSSLGMGPENYGWYQCRLHSAAREIYDSGGSQVIVKLWNALKTHQESMTDEEFISMLMKEVHSSVADVYLKWDSN